MLSNRQLRFVQEFCNLGDDESPARAYERAGYSANGADQGSHRLLRTVEIQDAIEVERRQIAAAARISPALVMRGILEVASSGRCYCCRHCWGVDHKYQWTEKEYARALDAALDKNEPPPDTFGMFGYVKSREPNQECPECDGEGVTRKTVKASDQLKAYELLGRSLGMFTDKTQLSGPGGGPIPLATATAMELTDEQLLALIAAGSAPLGVDEGVYKQPLTLEGGK